ncbi:CRAL/TRIO domain-containing protein [Macrolepiota fuliginosa MF-IS2]|uniref:Phosphatidylinositol transfer protein SFH5 n=1 Tax=Macrolepiota fuliginosa MF-IS2 TaxID=1400762 RepID=A0A9P5XNW9_9AGAR|nr:CRAL/TRIO domain-containing protein [Macrolepiota fuliginosa MF-IS2]
MLNASEPPTAENTAKPTHPEPAYAPAPVTTEIPTTTATAEAPQPAQAPSVPAETAAEPTAPAAPAAPEKISDEPEPQNVLTERFTTAEWTALKEFRSLLPDILADAFPDDPKAKETPFTIWGVKVDPSSPRNAKVSVVLMKFLRARNLSIPDARDMFQGTLRWRKSFDMEGALQEKFPEGLFDKMGHVYGKDKEGRPIMYNIYGGDNDLKAVFSDVHMFLRWRVALHERLMQELDFETVDQTVQIHDYEGVSITSRDANSKNAAQEAANIFASHYPELLFKKFFINVPTLLNWMFWAFKAIIPAATLAKMNVVGTGSHAIHKALSPYIPDERLPRRYGGQADGF